MATELRVATFANEMMAQYWAGTLEKEGIRSAVKPLLGGYGVFGHFSFVPHGLYVLQEDEERARALLGEAEQGR